MGDIALDEEDLQTLFPTEYERLVRTSAQNRAAHFADPTAAGAGAPRRPGAQPEDSASRGARTSAASGAANAQTAQTSEEDAKARREREEEEQKAQMEKERQRERQATSPLPPTGSVPLRPRGPLVRRPGRRHEYCRKYKT